MIEFFEYLFLEFRNLQNMTISLSYVICTYRILVSTVSTFMYTFYKLLLFFQSREIEMDNKSLWMCNNLIYCSLYLLFKHRPNFWQTYYLSFFIFGTKDDYFLYWHIQLHITKPHRSSEHFRHKIWQNLLKRNDP